MKFKFAETFGGLVVLLTILLVGGCIQKYKWDECRKYHPFSYCLFLDGR